MNDIPLPTSREAQIARRNIISAARAYLNKEASLAEVLCIFFSESKGDPILQSIYEERVFDFINNQENSLTYEKEFSGFIQQLLMLPLVNEEVDPCSLCSTEKERIDRQIVIELNKTFPELLNDKYYLDLLDLPTCAHLCYSLLVSKVNEVIRESDAYSASAFLRETFNLIEKVLKLHNSYARNVIAVSFLEGLADKNKEKWFKLLHPLSKQVYEELEEYLEKLFSHKL